MLILMPLVTQYLILLTGERGCRQVRGMARLARVVVPGYPHHITQRGNRRLPPGP